MAAWTSVPSRLELTRQRPTGGMPARVAPLPGGLGKEYFQRLGTSLSFPQNAETAGAIRRMARGEVSAIPNYCARTLREALGWGLGDAHAWTALPSRGYRQRPEGTAAQPGDIVVWPFTYGSRNSQHVGIAVVTDAGTRLLSNLSGDLGLTRLVPGYQTYFK
ncbi:MAG: CHAP domain-containing protein [Armatimonadota bacterium]